MKRYKVLVTKKTALTDTITVKASCPQEAKRLAHLIAKQQESAEALCEHGDVQVDGVKYPRFMWCLESINYVKEIV